MMRGRRKHFGAGGSAVRLSGGFFAATGVLRVKGLVTRWVNWLITGLVMLGLVFASGCSAGVLSSSSSAGSSDSDSSGSARGHEVPVPDDGQKPVIYTSFFPIQNLVESVAGDAAEVREFMPTGVDPHLWEPTARDIKKLASAELLVINGANLEPWVGQVKAAIPKLRILNLSEYVELISYKGAAELGEFQYMAASPALQKGHRYSIVFGHTHESTMRAGFFPYDPKMSRAELLAAGRKTLSQKGIPIEQTTTIRVRAQTSYEIAMGHERGQVDFEVPKDGQWVFVSDRVSQEILSYTLKDGESELAMQELIPGGSVTSNTTTFDPHSWLSVLNAKRYLNAINQTLSELLPDEEYQIQKRKVAIVSALTDLESEYREKFKSAKHKDFVVGHNGFAYLARDFGLKQNAVQGFTVHESPSLRSLVNTIRYTRGLGIKIIYYEYGTEEKTADTIAAEVGGRTLPLASMEYVNRDIAAKGYVELMRMNLGNLYESMR